VVCALSAWIRRQGVCQGFGARAALLTRFTMFHPATVPKVAARMYFQAGPLGSGSGRSGRRASLGPAITISSGQPSVMEFEILDEAPAGLDLRVVLPPAGATCCRIEDVRRMPSAFGGHIESEDRVGANVTLSSLPERAAFRKRAGVA